LVTAIDNGNTSKIQHEEIFTPLPSEQEENSMLTRPSPGTPSQYQLYNLLDDDDEVDSGNMDSHRNQDHFVSGLKTSATTTNGASQSLKEDIILQRIAKFEREQEPKYKLSYEVMRGIIPPTITKTKVKRMLAEGVPEPIAHHIWNNKVLWLICMHREDIRKVHVGDLRGKYNFHGLDIVEMRAVWYALPDWNEVIDPPKFEWREGFKMKLDEMAYRESSGKLTEKELRHSVYKVL
jgi:hypothetical protein